MNLTPQTLAQLEPGGLVFFAGGRNIFKAGLIGAILSGAIAKITGSPEDLSHVGIVPPLAYWSSPGHAALIESTEWQGISGPQLNDLEQRLSVDYEAKGGHAWFKGFQKQFAPDWPAVWTAALQMFDLVKQRKLHYSVERLLGDAVERDWVFSALPFAGILEHLSKSDKGIVCSDCAGLLCQAGGVDEHCKAAGVAWLPKVRPAGQPIGCSPEDLWELPIFGAPVTLL